MLTEEKELLIAIKNEGTLFVKEVENFEPNIVKVGSISPCEANDVTCHKRYWNAFKSLKKYGYIMQKTRNQYILTSSGLEKVEELEELEY